MDRNPLHKIISIYLYGNIDKAYCREKGMGSFFSKMGPKMEEKGPKADGREQKQKKWTKTPSQDDFFNVWFDC